MNSDIEFENATRDSLNEEKEGDEGEGREGGEEKTKEEEKRRSARHKDRATLAKAIVFFFALGRSKSGELAADRAKVRPGAPAAKVHAPKSAHLGPAAKPPSPPLPFPSSSGLFSCPPSPLCRNGNPFPQLGSSPAGVLIRPRHHFFTFPAPSQVAYRMRKPQEEAQTQGSGQHSRSGNGVCKGREKRMD